MDEYRVEVERLKLFISRFNALVEDTVKSYPSDKTRKLAAAADVMREILSSDDAEKYSDKEKIEKIYKLTEDLGKQSRSVYGVSENGFDMDEVLNPKEKLDLMSLCKELGVTE